jgi:hypothetical protein
VTVAQLSADVLVLDVNVKNDGKRGDLRIDGASLTYFTADQAGRWIQGYPAAYADQAKLNDL